VELRPGYKQTEVGVIPEDWEVTSLGEHATFRTGPFGSALHKSDYIKDGVPVVNPMHIVDGEIVPTVSMTITDSAALSLGEFRLRQGEIVIGRRGDMGRCAVVTPHQAGWLCGTGSMIIRPTGFDPQFLRRVLSSDAVISAIVNNSVGTTMVNLNQGSLSSLKVQYPPRAEQSAIATALGDADALLAAQDALIAKKRAIKQGAMQELLTGKRRLPGFSGEWEVKRLDQLAEIRSGGTPSTSRPEFWDGDVLWVTPTDITALDGQKVLSNTTRKITELGLKASSAEIIPANSIVMTSRATIGECAINAVPLSTNQGFKNFVPNASVDIEFLYYLLTTQKQGFISLCAGSTFLEIGKTQLTGYEVCIPAKKEQTAIATALSDIDTELTALETQRAKTAQLKQGMMQALLTGRIRLV